MRRFHQVKILFLVWLLKETGLNQDNFVTLHVQISNGGTEYTEHPMP